MKTDLGFHDNYCLSGHPRFGSFPVATAALSVITQQMSDQPQSRLFVATFYLPRRCTAHAACNVKAPSRFASSFTASKYIANLLFCRNLTCVLARRVRVSRGLILICGKHCSQIQSISCASTIFFLHFFFNPLFYNKQGPGDTEHM